MPPPPKFGGPLVTNIRNTSSPHWRGWLKPENRCLVPANSFSEYARESNPQTKKKDVVWFALNEERPLRPHRIDQPAFPARRRQSGRIPRRSRARDRQRLAMAARIRGLREVHPGRADPVRLMASGSRCLLCEDCGWVCENHPSKPFDGERACTCGGAGMPCPNCNPAEEGTVPRQPKGSRTDVDKKGGAIDAWQGMAAALRGSHLAAARPPVRDA
jgi:hypothetical protein